MPETHTIYRIEWTKTAAKRIVSFDQRMRERMLRAIQGLAQYPPVGDIKPLEGRHGKYRLRVGGYRVIFHYKKDGTITIILVEDIGSRGDIYK